jgi:L-asparaginase
MENLQRKTRVVVLGTGGTIAGLAATAEDDAAYRSAQIGVDALVAGLRVPPGITVETEAVAQIDSKDMDFATWRTLALALARHLARPEVAGVVVTHGTDTLEESAYFLERVVTAKKPVVLTGAMRPASARNADGPRNLEDAIAVAAEARLAGVVVVFAGEVHASRDVRKAHPRRVEAFTSGEAGPLARIVKGRIEAVRDLSPAGATIDVAALPADPRTWPWIEIVTSAAGVDGIVVALLADAGVDGIVVAATGNGSVHHRLEAALLDAAARGVAVVRASRCLDGAIVDAEVAVLPSAGALTPVKARIALMLDLLAGAAKV